MHAPHPAHVSLTAARWLKAKTGWPVGFTASGWFSVALRQPGLTLPDVGCWRGEAGSAQHL